MDGTYSLKKWITFILIGSIHALQHVKNNPHPDDTHLHPDEAAADADNHVVGNVAHGGHAMAIGMLAAATIIPLIAQFLLYGGIRTMLTWRLLDTFTAVFLAVLWFNAFGTIVHAIVNPYHPSPHIMALISCGEFLLLYLLVLAFGFWFKKNKLISGAFICCGTHYVSFAGVSSTGHGHYFVYQWLKDIFPMHWGTIIYIAFICILLILSVAISRYFRNMRQQDILKRLEASEDEIEHLENHLEQLDIEIGALVFSYLTIQTFRLFLTGRYPPLHFLQTDHPIGHNRGANRLPSSEELAARAEGEHGHDHEHHHFIHTQAETNIMLFTGIGLIIITAIFLRSLHSKNQQYLSSHSKHFIRLTLVMLIAWCFLLWGQWQWVDRMFSGDELFGLLAFALLCTVVSLIALQIFSWVYRFHSVKGQEEEWMRDCRRAMKLAVSGMSLVAAWSWEHAFDMALDVFGEMNDMGYGGLIPKTVLAVLIPPIVFPVYLAIIRPKAELDIEHFKTEEELAEERRALLVP